MGQTCCKDDSDQGEDAGQYLTDKEFVDMISERSARFLPEGEDGKMGRKDNFRVSVEYVEQLVLGDEEDEESKPPTRRASGRKGTGYVSKKDIEAADTKLSFADSVDIIPGDASMPLQNARHSKGRKGTGFISKDQLLEALSKIEGESDEDVPEADEIKQVDIDVLPHQGPNPDISTQAEVKRCKARKSTGFVTKERLKK